ncbi:hypothetical protein JIR23_17105 [Bradyrhizobium diazoefficiens]|nr:hypothetical protein [Bradyrhizobium diazoefficiens]QQN61384.1 hypothetical protein JIR23_17105 [Bradyrhizobium diazoefficiens]
MQLENQRIRFDLSLYKTVPFSFLNPGTYRSASDMLKKQIQEAIVDGYKPDNPVTRSLGQQHFEQTASGEMKVVADQLGSLTARIPLSKAARVPRLLELSLISLLCGFD